MRGKKLAVLFVVAVIAGFVVLYCLGNHPVDVAPVVPR